VGHASRWRGDWFEHVRKCNASMHVHERERCSHSTPRRLASILASDGQRCSTLAVDGLTPPRLAAVASSRRLDSATHRMLSCRATVDVCGRATAGVMAGRAYRRQTAGGRIGIVTGSSSRGAGADTTERDRPTALRDQGTWIAGGRADAQAAAWICAGGGEVLGNVDYYAAGTHYILLLLSMGWT